MLLTAQKVDCIFEESFNSHFFSWLFFFSSILCGFQENKIKLKRLFHLNHRLRGNTTKNTHSAFDSHFSSFSNASEFLNWNNICFISECSDSFNYNPKKLIHSKYLSIAHQMHFAHWRIPSDKTFRGSYFH